MGLLDMFSGNDPQNQGLLAAAAQMLQASGPSLMPHSFGQVLGQGIGGFQAGKEQALNQQKEQMQMQMLQQQVAQATRKNELINNFLAANMGGGQGQGQSQQPSQAAAPSPQSLSMGSMDSDGRTISAPGFFPPADRAQQSAPQPAMPSASGFGGIPASAIAADLAFNNGQKMGEWINDRAKPTDFTKLLEQAGIDPNSTLGQQIMRQQVAKQNNIPLQAGRSGAPMYDANGQIVAMAPIIPKNAVPKIVNGQVVGVSPLDGASGVEQINAYADQAGKNQAEPIAAYDDQGMPIYTNKLKAAGGAQPAPSSGIDITHMTPTERATVMKSAQKLGYLRPGSQPGMSAVRPSLAPGVEKSIAGNVDTMNNDFSDLYSANKNAPTTLALLDNIKQLAPKAITGAEADKLAFNNGLLALAGVPAAKDLATATDLLNKNAAMLAANMRKSAGAGGTDAFQALAQASNPNNHMQPDALIKAADEIIGQVKMTQDQYQKLQPFKLNNDVRGYYEAQKQFSSQADPRKYQPDSTKFMSLSDIAATAKASGKTTAEVTAAARKAGYTIGGQ